MSYAPYERRLDNPSLEQWKSSAQHDFAIAKAADAATPDMPVQPSVTASMARSLPCNPGLCSRITPQSFPFRAQIQRAFGPNHNIGGLTAYTGPAAQAANTE